MVVEAQAVCGHLKRKNVKKVLPLAILVAILVGVAYFVSQQDSKSTTRKDQTNFAIEDTSLVGKIFIADAKGRKVTLTREEDGAWMADKKYIARPDAVRLLLITFKNVYVQRPVPADAQEQVNRVMAGSAKKVEVYDLNGKWMKTWYVGYGTMDKKGTYMLLETPEYGKAAAPYILDKKGFLGMLDTRFFTNLEEWRSTVVFTYPDLDLSEIHVTYPTSPDSSFRIEYGGGNDIKLFARGSDRPFSQFDTSLVKDYMMNYKLASFENFNTELTPAQEDSVMTHIPYQVIKVVGKKDEHEIRLWSKSAPEGTTEDDGKTPAVVDRVRVYAATNDNVLATAQRQKWDQFRAPLQAFIRSGDE